MPHTGTAAVHSPGDQALVAAVQPESNPALLLPLQQRLGHLHCSKRGLLLPLLLLLLLPLLWSVGLTAAGSALPL
jgi:hypothetical protein